MEFEKYAGLMGWLFAVLGVVLMVLGIGVTGDNIYTGLTYTTVGFFQLLVALSEVLRLGGKEGMPAGVVVVQHNWWIVSIGIAALAVFPSSFFSISSAALMFLASMISAIWVILGAANIYLAVKRTGARAAA
jgi:hypothetical protein